MLVLHHRLSNSRVPASECAAKQLHVIARPVHPVKDWQSPWKEPLQHWNGQSTGEVHQREHGEHDSANNSHTNLKTAHNFHKGQQHRPQQVHIASPPEQHSFQPEAGALTQSSNTSGCNPYEACISRCHTGLSAKLLTKSYLLLLEQFTQQRRQQELQLHDCSGTNSSNHRCHSGVMTGQPEASSAAADLEQHHTQLQQLLQHTHPVLQQLRPQQASLILYTAAKVGGAVPAALLDDLIQQLQLQQLPAAGVTNTLWSVAVLNYVPVDAASWFDSFYIASSSLLQGDHFNHHQLTSLLWSIGKLKQQPPADWIEIVLSKLRPSLCRLTVTELSNTLWGLAQISYRPDNLWCKAWFRASYKALPSCSVHHLSCMVGSLGLLRLSTASGTWLVRYRLCVQQQLLQLESNHVATIMCGLAKRCSCQPPHWVALLLRRQLQLLTQPHKTAAHPAAVAQVQVAQQEAMNVQPSTYARPAVVGNQQKYRSADIAATVWALPRLLYPTSKSWGTEPQNAALLRLLAAVSLPLLPTCSAGELVQLAVGFSGLCYHPGTHWLKVHENAIAAKYSGLSSNDKAKLRAAVKMLWLGG